MTPAAHQAAALRAELAAAFAGRARPLDDRVALTREDCPTYEGSEARAWLADRSWQQLVEEGVDIEHRDYLSFLTHEGWLYYFPAFATLALDIAHPAGLDEALVFRLWSFPEEIADLLAPAERRAIVHLLEYLADAYDDRGDTDNRARVALEHFWAYFTEAELRRNEEPYPIGDVAERLAREGD